MTRRTSGIGRRILVYPRAHCVVTGKCPWPHSFVSSRLLVLPVVDQIGDDTGVG